MRLISCSMTQRQIRDRSKTETRRLGWKNVKVGDLLCFVDKCMGFKKGEKPQRIADVIVTDVRREILAEITQDAVIREGFPEMSEWEFILMFAKTMKCQFDDYVTVIRFKYIPGGNYNKE